MEGICLQLVCNEYEKTSITSAENPTLYNKALFTWHG